MKAWGALLAVFAATPAEAELIVDQIERLDVERGEREWELQAVHANAHDGDASESMLNLSGEFGVSDRWALGFELESEREGAHALEADAIALQAKFVAIDPEQAPFGLGAQLSLERSLHGAETDAELRLLSGAELSERLTFASDIGFSSTLEGDGSHDVAVRYAARVDWRRDWGALGLEGGGGWGALNDLRWSDNDRHWLGSSLTLDAGPASIEAAVFAGLTHATPDAQFRLQIELR